MVVVVLVKCYRKRSDNISGKGITTSIRPLTTKSDDQETDHECIFQNPTYQSNNIIPTSPIVTVRPADDDNNLPEHALEDNNDCTTN